MIKHFIKYILVSFLLLPTISWGQALTEIPEVIKSEFDAPAIDANSWILVNYDTGWVVAEHNADLRIEPASLTKLMTGYLVFAGVKSGELSLDDQVPISKKAGTTGGSKMFARVGSRVLLSDLLQGLIVQSGNDAAVALAEYVAGSEGNFAKIMNRKAIELGMENTRFANSSGLPAEQHYSTARDVTILSMALIRDFPDMYKFYSQKEYTYDNIRQYNRNTLLWDDESIDGVKTGFTNKAGYCLIGSANRKQFRYIASVIGASSKQARAEQVRRLLEFGYRAYSGSVVYQANETVAQTQLFMGQVDTAAVQVADALKIIYPKGQADKVVVTLRLPSSFDAPLTTGTVAGEAVVKFKDTIVSTQEVYLAEDYALGSLLSRLLDMVRKAVLSLW